VKNVSELHRAELKPKQSSLKRNFSWSLAGNVIYQACQWIVVVVIAKFLSVTDVGNFALAISICAPLSAFSGLNLRTVQVTDTQNNYRFGHFLATQLSLSGLAFILLVLITVVSEYEAETAWLIVVVGVGQAIIVIREVFIAYHQKYEHMDTVGISKALNGIYSLVALGIVVWTTRHLLSGVIAMQAARLSVFLFWDLPATTRLARFNAKESPRAFLGPVFQNRIISSLIWLAMPLGVSVGLLSLTSNVPRYFIRLFLNTEALGYFTAVISLAMAGQLVAQAASISALPRLTQYYISNRGAYHRLLRKLVLFGIGIGMAGIVVVMIAGRQILTLAFTSAYARYTDLFIWAMLFGVIEYSVTFLDLGLMGMRKFKTQPIILTAGLLTVTVIGYFLIPEFGLIGAILSFIFGRLITAAIYLYIIGQDYLQYFS
jgi:O-antigen/teichoic acid export membrane protein